MVSVQALSWNVICSRCNSLVLFVLPAAAHRHFCTSRLTALSSSNQARTRLFRTSSDAHSCFILSSLFGFISNLFFSVSLIYNASLFFAFSHSQYQSLNTTESISHHSWQLVKVDPFQYFTDVLELNLFYPMQAVKIISESFPCQLIRSFRFLAWLDLCVLCTELSWNVWALNESWDFYVVTDRIVRSILQTGLLTQQHRLLETGV